MVIFSERRQLVTPWPYLSSHNQLLQKVQQKKKNIEIFEDPDRGHESFKLRLMTFQA